MAQVSLLELRTRARQHADMEGDSSFVTDEELTRRINNACWALDDMLHNTFEDFYLATWSGVLAPLVNSLGLPEDFYKMVSVDVSDSGGTWYALKPYVNADRIALKNADGQGIHATRYRLQNRELRFLPPLTGATHVELSYYPQIPALRDEEDTREYPNGWEEWVCLTAAIGMLTKEERDPSALVALLNAETARINASAPIRDQSTPQMDDMPWARHWNEEW